MADLDDIIEDVAESALSGVAAAIKEVDNVVSSGESDFAKAFSSIGNAFMAASVNGSKTKDYPYKVTFRGEHLGWKNSAAVKDENGIAYVIDPNRKDHIATLVDSKGKHVAFIDFEKPHFFGKRGNITTITITEQNFSLDIDWRKKGILYQVEDLIIVSGRHRSITVSNAGVEVIKIDLKSFTTKVYYKDEVFAPLAVSLAIAGYIARVK